ncbi:MAG: hypothetical protein J6I76_15930 [Oribacterium sp.]|nr:hypothetical protein [Oribacterium sp.]
MQNLLKKLGFTRCGTIYVEEDDYPRIAFEKIRDWPTLQYESVAGINIFKQEE